MFVEFVVVVSAELAVEKELPEFVADLLLVRRNRRQLQKQAAEQEQALSGLASELLLESAVELEVALKPELEIVELEQAKMRMKTLGVDREESFETCRRREMAKAQKKNSRRS